MYGLNTRTQLWVGVAPDPERYRVLFSRFGNIAAENERLWRFNWFPLRLDGVPDPIASYVELHAHSVEWRIGDKYLYSGNGVADLSNLTRLFSIANEAVKVGLAKSWRLGPDYPTDEDPTMGDVRMAAAHYPRENGLDARRFIIAGNLAVRVDAFDRIADVPVPDGLPRPITEIEDLNQLLANRSVFKVSQLQLAESTVTSRVVSSTKLIFVRFSADRGIDAERFYAICSRLFQAVKASPLQWTFAWTPLGPRASALPPSKITVHSHHVDWFVDTVFGQADALWDVSNFARILAIAQSVVNTYLSFDATVKFVAYRSTTGGEVGNDPIALTASKLVRRLSRQFMLFDDVAVRSNAFQVLRFHDDDNEQGAVTTDSVRLVTSLLNRIVREAYSDSDEKYRVGIDILDAVRVRSAGYIGIGYKPSQIRLFQIISHPISRVLVTCFSLATRPLSVLSAAFKMLFRRRP